MSQTLDGARFENGTTETETAIDKKANPTVAIVCPIGAIKQFGVLFMRRTTTNTLTPSVLVSSAQPNENDRNFNKSIEKRNPRKKKLVLFSFVSYVL